MSKPIETPEITKDFYGYPMKVKATAWETEFYLGCEQTYDSPAEPAVWEYSVEIEAVVKNELQSPNKDWDEDYVETVLMSNTTNSLCDIANELELEVLTAPKDDLSGVLKNKEYSGEMTDDEFKFKICADYEVSESAWRHRFGEI